MSQIESFFERWADRIIWLFILAYISAFSYVSCLKFYSFGYTDWDFASDVIIYWNSVHGKLLYYPFLETNILGAHLFLVILLILPIYAMFQYPLTILFLQTIVLGTSAYPLYLLAKLKLNKTFALSLSLCFLLYPTLGFVNLFESHFDSFSLFPLFFALYFFEKERFKGFLVSIFFALLCKEIIGMIVFMFGIYALIRQRPKRWIFTPMILGFFWFFLAIKLVCPYFAKDKELYPGGFMFTTYYQHFGRTIPEMIKTICLHPLAMIKFAFAPAKLSYLFQLFLPTGFLCILSPGALLITIPIFLQNLLSSRYYHSLIQFQHSLILLPFIFASYVNGIRRLLNYKIIHSAILLTLCLVLSIISNLYSKAPQLLLREHIKAYRIDELTKQKDRLIKMIPRDASVIATFQFLPKLAQRHNLCSMHLVSTGFKMYADVKYQPPENLEYALIDFNELLMLRSFFPPQAPDNIRNFLEKGDFRVLSASDDIILFKKGCPDGKNLGEIVSSPKIERIVNANIDNKIIFSGFNMESKIIKPEAFLHLTYYWKRVKKVGKEIALSLEFMNSNGQVVFQKIHTPGYRIYFPPDTPDSYLKEEHWVFIPSNISPQKYSLRMSIFSLDGEILPVLSKDNIDNMGRIILSDISVQ